MAPLLESLTAGVGAALGFLALYVTSQALTNVPGEIKCMCPPLGAVAVLLFCLCAAASFTTRATLAQQPWCYAGRTRPPQVHGQQVLKITL